MCHGSNNYNMHDCYFEHGISKAGPEVLEKRSGLWIMFKEINITYDCQNKIY